MTAPDDSNPDIDYDRDPEGEPAGGGDKAPDVSSYDPCHEKRCGATCTQCSPADENCDELQVLKACDAQSNCVIGPVDCSAPAAEPKE